jgi:hypothetical protein
MRLPTPCLILFMVLIAAAFSAAQGQSYTDDAVLQYAKSIDVAKLDSTLSSQRLEDWLLRGPARIDELYWNISQNCDLKDLEPDADGDLPLCVKLGLRRRSITGFGVLRVGTLKHGVSGQPALQYLDVLRPFSVGSYDKLSDFPRFLDGIDQTQNTKNEIHLRATVQNIVPLTDFSGEITPVDFDPRFALTVRIESVDAAVGSFTVGAVVAFAIHSPALLFGEDATKGKTYNSSIQRAIKHSKTRFSGLKFEKVQTAPAM